MKLEKISVTKCNDERFYLDKLTEDKDGLEIRLSNSTSSRTVEITFQNIFGYRSFDETNLIKTLDDNPDLCVEHVFFKVHSSTFVKWLSEQKYDALETDKVHHYLFATPNEIIEVLSKQEPQIKFLDLLG